MAIKFNQYWDIIPGRKAEYVDFINQDFLPTMKRVGVKVVAGWFVIIGETPHVISEGIVEDIRHIQEVLESADFKAMLSRHMKYVRNYSNKVLIPTGRVQKEHGVVPPPKIVKFNQSWNILPGREEDYDRFIREKHIPTMEELGIEIAAGWNVIMGSGPYIISEGHAKDLATIAKALSDERYTMLMAELEDLVEDYRSRVLVRHRFFLKALEEVYGGTMKAISEEEISSMYGPLVW